MDTEVKVALITAMTSIVIALIPVVLRYFRSKGVEISSGQENFIRECAIEAGQYAEEISRGKSMTSEQKISMAVEHMKKLLDKHEAIPTPENDELRRRIEALLATALPGHAGQPTAAVATVPAPDTEEKIEGTPK